MKKYFICLFIASSIHAQSLEQIWGIFELNKKASNEMYKISEGIYFPNQNILKIELGNDNSIWFTTEDYIIEYLPTITNYYSKKNPSTKLQSSFNSTQEQEFILQYEILESSHDYWLKYYDILLSWIIDKNRFKTPPSFYFPEGKSHNYELQKIEISVSDLLPMIKNQKLLFDLDINSTELFELKDDFENNSIEDIIFDGSGRFWFLSSNKLFRNDGKNLYLINLPVSCIEIDRENNLWIGTSHGNNEGNIIKYDGDEYTLYNYLNSPLPKNSGITDIKCDNNGNMWISFKGLDMNKGNLSIILISNDLFLLPPIVSGFNVTTVGKPVKSGNFETLYLTSVYSLNIENIPETIAIEVKDGEKFYHKEEIEVAKIQSGNIKFETNSYNYLKDPLEVFLLDSIRGKTLLGNFDILYTYKDKKFFLEQNEPNPFSDITKIDYGFYEGKKVNLKIFNQYSELIDSSFYPNPFYFTIPHIFYADDLPNGIYYYYLEEEKNKIVGWKNMLLFDPNKIITLPPKEEKP